MRAVLGAPSSDPIGGGNSLGILIRRPAGKPEKVPPAVLKNRRWPSGPGAGSGGGNTEANSNGFNGVFPDG